MITEKINNEVSVFARGLNPVTLNGEEYRATVTNWFPLWLYVAETCEDLLSKDESGSGFYPKQLRLSLSEKSAIELAQRLHNKIRSGETQEYINKFFNTDPVFEMTIQDVKDFAVFCGTSGGIILQ